MTTLKALDTFWELWKTEYLTSLRERILKKHVNHKVTENCSSRVGEIVLLDGPETPRGLWKLANTKELKKEKDGIARAALIEMPYGKLLTRPINILYSFEADIKIEIERKD
uniref:DUF5641 domain-containing protein n=1 Tax=Loa loa TaxID=7209 RepID=A0A1I7VRE8_LOALO